MNPSLDNQPKKLINILKLSELQVGKAGEYLVCVDLILNGYVAYPSEQGLPYDIIADVNGKLLKIQVKSTRKATNTPQRTQRIPTYRFALRRCGKGGRKKYQNNEIDLIAFVSLQNKKIGYMDIKNVPLTTKSFCEKIVSYDTKLIERWSLRG